MKIIKGLSLFFGKLGHTEPEEEKHKFLVINTNLVQKHYGILTDFEYLKTTEFSKLEDVKRYIENDVSKNEMKYIRIYQEIIL